MDLMNEDLARVYVTAHLEEAQQLRRGQRPVRSRRSSRGAEQAQHRSRLAARLLSRATG